MGMRRTERRAIVRLVLHVVRNVENGPYSSRYLVISLVVE